MSSELPPEAFGVLASFKSAAVPAESPGMAQQPRRSCGFKPALSSSTATVFDAPSLI
jgi:hypothetical protein